MRLDPPVDVLPMIDAVEWRCHCANPECSGKVLPPDERIVLAVEGAARFCYLWFPGLKLTLTSGRRCAEHNAATPGASPDSAHVRGTAADLAFPDLGKLFLAFTKTSPLDFLGFEVGPKHLHVQTQGHFSMTVAREVIEAGTKWVRIFG